ncbi:hypothetical protein Btru_038969 [Bulinus truncatus]|nr:hypothetical protein Btru_038969 [Bulinus truncatus]
MRLAADCNKSPSISPDLRCCAYVLRGQVEAAGLYKEGSRSLPIHCVVEQGNTSEAVSAEVTPVSAHLQLLVDSYAILPGSTPFSQIVSASLSKLGYTSHDALGAKGCLQLKNWKTLSFSDITDNPEATVEEILGEITSVATLKIRLLNSAARSSNSCNRSDDVKEKLLQLLLTKSKDFLLQAGCPIDKSLLDSILMGDANHNISDHLCSSFNEWFMGQKEHISAGGTPHSKPLKQPPLFPPPLTRVSSPVNMTFKPIGNVCDGGPMASSPTSRETPQGDTQLMVLNIKTEEQALVKSENLSDFSKVEFEVSHGHPHNKQKDLVSPPNSKNHPDKTMDKSSAKTDPYKISRSPSDDHIPSTLQHHPSNPYLGLMPGKTRIRTSFDPEHEIPRLQKWFTDNQHPTREQMMRFMQELNGLESRKGRRPLDLTNIIYWFKNARAAQRRASKALDDSFENEENVDLASGGSVTDCVPPYLPNKNAVYMIPFHPYPHLLNDSVSDPNSASTGTGIDEPYDLSVSRRTSDISKVQNGKDKTDTGNSSVSAPPSPSKSSPGSPDVESLMEIPRKRKPCSTPRFPALLDVASKLRQEIPDRSNDMYHSSRQNGDRHSPLQRRSTSNDQDRPGRHNEVKNGYSSQSVSIVNGVADHFLTNLKIKHENGEYMARESNPVSKGGGYHHLTTHAPRDSGLEMGQIKKEQDMGYTDDENTNDSYNSEEELKFRMKQSAAVVDYASAIHNNVSRLTAANMAALSLAQMGQSLHIPQLPPSLAMAYYPMDPRFYTQTSVQHSLSSSPPSSLTSNHSSHLAQLSMRQNQDSSAHNMDSTSPLPSPSSIQQSINKLNHHHQQHHQRHSPQEHHHRHHSSEQRKRRTRVFIDPLTEIPKLEKWFTEDTHPSAFMIDKYCEELNKCEYRHKFPKLEPKNVQLWFKNHRAKVKRMKVSYDGQDPEDNGCLDDDMDSKLFLLKNDLSN